MAISNEPVEYDIDGKTFEAHVARTGEAAPGVIICHAWAGRSAFENQKADELAALGYTGVAIDLFGKGVLGQSVEENQKLIQPFTEDRGFMQERLKANIDFARGLPHVKDGPLAAIGFCFGGMCVLDMARAKLDVAGVVSFHGLLGAPGNTKDNLDAKILALHGWDDPMAPPDDVKALGHELNEAGADWQLHAYGGVMHAFTNPQADDPDFGTVYDAAAAARSWEAMKYFLAEEVFK